MVGNAWQMALLYPAKSWRANTSTEEVARFSISGGGTTYGPLSIRGTDFDAPDAYQEFPLDFTFHETEDAFLIFNFWRSGSADVYVDGVTLYTHPLPVSSPLTWTVPDGNYQMWVSGCVTRMRRATSPNARRRRWQPRDWKLRPRR
jgi:hypothetical protein